MYLHNMISQPKLCVCREMLAAAVGAERWATAHQHMLAGARPPDALALLR